MSSKRYLTVYNLAREKDWVLKNAFDVIETKEINTVWSLEFSIPMNDDDMEHCNPNWYVRYGDDGQMYRFTDQTKTNANVSTVTYHCEHVIATLCDDVMYQGPYIIGNTGTYTNQVIDYVLNKQTVKNWVLDVCQPRRQFEYSWENENLLAALFSIPTCFDTPYMWTYDTSVYPWKVSLVNINENDDPNFYLMAKKNILRSVEDSSNLDICTRLYGLGEGEGVNQLTIKSVNNGVPYVQSEPEIIAKYGIVSRIFVDRRFQYPETLKARMETLLHELEKPTLKREFEIVDLYDLSPDDMYKAEVGAIVLLKDDDTKVYITKTVKNWSIPGDMKITICTKATDMSSSIADLADRQRIEQVYSQGASQVYSFSFFGNATSEYPLDGYVYFPDDLKYLNEVKLKVMLKPFRSYSKSAISNGGFTKNVTTEESKERTTTSEDSKEQTTTSEESKEQTTTSEESKEQTTTSEDSKEYDLTLENVSSTTTSISKSSTTSEGGSADGTTDSTTGGGDINVTLTGEASNTEDASWAEGSDLVSSKTKVGNDGGLKATSYGSSHNHNVIGYTGEVTPPASANYKHSHAMNFTTDNGNYGGEHSHTVYEESWTEGHSHTFQRSRLKHYHDVIIKVNGQTSSGGGFAHTHSFNIKSHTHSVDISHTHDIRLDHKHDLTIPSHSHKVTIPSHSHKVTIPSHSHKVTIPSHSHKVTIPAHSHSLTVDPHSHFIEPGIFESGNPRHAKLYIDDVEKAIIDTQQNTELNITDYLKKNGKVPRGQWIKISIKPSDAAPNNMAYISVFGNTFAYIQSYTGGNY